MDPKEVKRLRDMVDDLEGDVNLLQLALQGEYAVSRLNLRSPFPKTEAPALFTRPKGKDFIIMLVEDWSFANSVLENALPPVCA